MARRTACDVERWRSAAGTLFHDLAVEARRKGFRLTNDIKRRALRELAEALRDDCSDPEGVARRIAERLI